MEEAPIKKAIDEFVRTMRMGDKLMSYDIKAAWPAIMGKTIDRHTLKIYIRSRILYIHVDSSALRNELELGTVKLLSLVNDYAGRQVVEDLVLL